MIVSTYTVDFSEDYEELSLHSTTFDKLQRKVQAADVIGKKKLATSEGVCVLSNLHIVHCVFPLGSKESSSSSAKSDGRLFTTSTFWVPILC